MQKQRLLILFLLGLTMLAFTKLPFAEAETFLRDKVDLPTKAYDDISRGMHGRAFVVAGAMKNELLADIRQEVDNAISKGTTLAEFKKSFTSIIERRGWKGSARSPVDTPRRVGWRAGVIFNTNLRTAYAAGHFQQSQLVRNSRPFWRYVGGLSGDPRPLHLAWSGKILPANHPWFNRHYPPNGWGCKCKVVTVSRSEMKRRGLSGPDKPPTPTNDTAGIDKGWDYNPGRAAFGGPDNLRLLQESDKQRKKFIPLIKNNWVAEGQPEFPDADKMIAKVLNTQPEIKPEFKGAVVKTIGGEQKVFSFRSGAFRYDFNVDADALASYLSTKRGRGKFIPLLNETIDDPFEVWQSFEEHEVTGKVVLRHRFIKRFQGGKKESGVLFVTDARDGKLEGWNMIPMRDIKEMNKNRVGKLIFKRKGS